MLGFRKSPISKIFKQHSVDPELSGSSSPSPFDSHTKPARKFSSEPSLFTPNISANPFDDGNETRTTASSTSFSSTARSKYRNDFQDSGEFGSQSVQELEDYAVYKATETTKTVDGCLMIAENMRADASNTLVNLNQQGEQITGTHMMAADMDPDLSRGEKLLGSLGGMFSRTWKPKKTRAITGPKITRDDPTNTGGGMEQREKLGLSPAPKPRSAAQTVPAEPTDALQKVEVEKAKQEDALSDLSNILGDLKNMAVDMGTEIDRQNKALGHFEDDVEELNFRVRGVNQRVRRLLGR